VSRPATAEERALWERAVEAREQAYAPYSDFPVGAALRVDGGDVITGANVENGSYGLTICAERSAVAAAVSQGHRRFAAIAVAADPGAVTASPCGACRQVLAEFAPDMPVTYQRKGELVTDSVSELLPASFELRPGG
jgi:cytidine deaminase